VTQWRGEAEYLRSRGLTESAALTDAHADDLVATLESEGAEEVNLTEGARRSGYSADHLGKLIREGQLENVGRKHAPRVRVVDLPRKPGRNGGIESGVVSRWVREHRRRGAAR
jgi:hypothetical protein